LATRPSPLGLTPLSLLGSSLPLRRQAGRLHDFPLGPQAQGHLALDLLALLLGDPALLGGACSLGDVGF
jgi:hypothetical protein